MIQSSRFRKFKGAKWTQHKKVLFQVYLVTLSYVKNKEFEKQQEKSVESHKKEITLQEQQISQIKPTGHKSIR